MALIDHVNKRIVRSTGSGLHFVALFLAISFGFAGTAAEPGKIFRDCKDCPEMIVIPPGEFQMGARSDEYGSAGLPVHLGGEVPQHTVKIEYAFALGRYTVTRDEWAAYIASLPKDSEAATSQGCSVLIPSTGEWKVDPARSWRDPGFKQTGRDPVVCINWNEAKAYTAWLSKRTRQSYRLPSEAEWEYAARAGTTTINYWGSDRLNACRFANASDLTRAEVHAYARNVPDSSFLCHDRFVFTAPVNAFPPNPWKLYGMSGNVWQMVEDCVHEGYTGAPTDGSVWSGGDCTSHIDRGASWVNSPKYVRVAARHTDLTDARTSVLGFRLARDLGH